MSFHENLNSESTLISIAKWGIVSVKIPGYFPICVKTSPVKFLKNSKFEHRRRLFFSYCSSAAFYTLILLGILTCWDLVFFASQSAFHKYLKARGPTEIYAYTFMLATSSLLGIYITLFGLRKSQKFLQFWKDTVGIFDQLQDKLGFNVSNRLHAKGSFADGDRDDAFSAVDATMERFCGIERSIRNSFLTMIFPIVLHVLIDYGYRIANSFSQEEGDPEIAELTIGLGVWTFFALSGSGVYIWMTFFVQFYTACLLAVADSIRHLSGPSNANKVVEHISEMKNYANGDELFSRVILQPQLQPLQRSNRMEKVSKVKGDIESSLETSLSIFQSIIGGIGQFNEFYGVIIIFEMSVCVLNLLVYLFFALVWLGRGELGLLVETLVPTYIYGKELFDMGSFSEELTAAGEAVVKAFGEDIPLSSLSPHMHLKLQMLATQISTNPPAISAKQFFVINRGLVTSVLSGLATFLVVLVQFREADVKT